MRTPTDFSKSTDVPQNNKALLIPVHEAEKDYPRSPISVREILDETEVYASRLDFEKGKRQNTLLPKRNSRNLRRL